MNGYVQHDEEIEVPKGTGVRGFLATIEAVLKLPRVQRVEIDSRGKISYSFLLREGELAKPLAMKFENLMPYAIVRNAQVQEVQLVDTTASTSLLRLFRQAAIEHLAPTGFVTGIRSALWAWYEDEVPAEIRDELLGLPVYVDENCPDEVLLLCASFKRTDTLEQTHKVYKILIPTVTP